MFRRLRRQLGLLWMTLRSPSRYYSLCFLTVAGFVAGVLLGGGFNTALEATNTAKFCTRSHEMRYTEIQELQASKEVWGKVFGTINARQKFLDERLVLAGHEWSRLKANDSLECRNCHDFDSMDLTRQSARAAEVHRLWLGTGQKTCIDCHKGI